MNYVGKARTRANCAVCTVAIALIGTSYHVGAQTTPGALNFEVATVKPVPRDASHRFDPNHFGPHVTQARASYWSMSLSFLLSYAYNTESKVRGPEWTDLDRFDIEARFPEGADTKDDRRMLQALLKDRFKLTFHTEKVELEGYALVVGSHGSKLVPSVPDPATSAAGAASDAIDKGVLKEPSESKTIKNANGSITIDRGKQGTQTVSLDQENWVRHYQQSKTTMDDLARRIGVCIGTSYQRVANETGIRGEYQVAYDCPTPRPRKPPTAGAVDSLPPDPDNGYALTRSLDLLGLKLEKRKVMQDVYVIDHAEKPSDN